MDSSNRCPYVPARGHHHDHNSRNLIDSHEKPSSQGGNFKIKMMWGDKHDGHRWNRSHGSHGRNVCEETHMEEEPASRGKRQPNLDGDVEFISDHARSMILSGMTEQHGGNYKSERDFQREKRGHKLHGEDLVYDQKSGLIVDQKTGIAYELRPVQY